MDIYPQMTLMNAEEMLYLRFETPRSLEDAHDNLAIVRSQRDRMSEPTAIDTGCSEVTCATFVRTSSVTCLTRRFTSGLLRPASSARRSKFLARTLSELYSPPIFIAIFLDSSG